jgi:hypothetical protein
VKYQLSQHALIRLQERKIEIAWLEQTISQPERTEPDEIDSFIEHRLAKIAERDNRVLRVVCDSLQLVLEYHRDEARKKEKPSKKPWRVVVPDNPKDYGDLQSPVMDD